MYSCALMSQIGSKLLRALSANVICWRHPLFGMIIFVATWCLVFGASGVIQVSKDERCPKSI